MSLSRAFLTKSENVWYIQYILMSIIEFNQGIHMARRKALSADVVISRAAEIARRDGIDNVTYNGLARELGIRPQSMYRYVPDLRSLRVALIGGFLRELVDKLKKEMEGQVPAAALRTFALCLYDECHANPWYYESFRLMHLYGIVPDLREILTALVELIQLQFERIEAEPAAAARSTQLFMAVNLGFAQMAMTPFMPVSLRDDREVFEMSIDRFMTSLYNHMPEAPVLTG